MDYNLNEKGKWEIQYESNGTTVMNTLQTAVHASIIYNAIRNTWKILYFRADLNEGGVIKTKIWTPPTDTTPASISEQIIESWPGDPLLTPLPRLFCSGHTHFIDFADNKLKLFAAGGNKVATMNPQPPPPYYGLDYAYIFNEEDETWQYLGSPFAAKPMPNGGRWYPTVTLLHTSNLLVMSGWTTQPFPNLTPVIYKVSSGVWIALTDHNAQMPFPDLYPAAHVVARGDFIGKVFYSMPMKQAFVFDPFAVGSAIYWNPVGNERTNLRTEGCSIAMPISPFPDTSVKFLILGGKDGNSTFGEFALDTAEMIDLGTGARPRWSFVNPMNFRRAQANGEILPDGKIFVIGGNQINQREAAVTFPEIFDPEAVGGMGSWTIVAPNTFTRMYHSVALVMLDARVWVAGGDSLNGVPSSDFIEIYSPPYLFDFDNTKPRPIISDLRETILNYNKPFDISTNVQIERAMLLSLGSTTHAFDQNQRAAYLKVVPGIPNGIHPYTLTAPYDEYILPPGYYMLFISTPLSGSISNKNRIPSIGIIIKLER